MRWRFEAALLVVAVAGCSDVVGARLGDGELRRNLPPGWSTLTDYGFEDAPPTHVDGRPQEAMLGSSGWRVTDWGLVGGGPRRSSDAGAPVSPQFVMEEVYPPHLSGQGPDKVSYYLSPRTKIYISWLVKWESGFHHNTTSEKMIYFNHTGVGDQFLFEFTYGVEMVQYIQEGTGYEALRANQLPPNFFGHGNAPPTDGAWIEYELLFDSTTGTVMWWKNGQLRGSHTARSFTPIRLIEITGTWGGGGDKQGTHSRYTDHIFVATGS